MNAKKDQKNVTELHSQTPQPKTDPRDTNPLRVLVKRRWQLFGCLLLICGIAFAAVSLRQAKYQATTRVQMIKDQPQIGNVTSLPSSDRDYISTQCILLQSRPVLAQAAEKLNMAGGHWTYSDEGVKQLRDAVKVQPVSGSRLIDIVATAETSSKAAAIANQVAAAYIDISTRARKAMNEQMAEKIGETITKYDEEMSHVEENIRRFQQENLITGSNSTLAAVEGRIARIENELTQAQMQRLQLETMRDKYKNILSSGRGLTDSHSAAPEITNDPVIHSHQQELTALEKEEARMARAYLPGHDKLRNTRLRIAELQTKILEKKQNRLQELFENTTKDYAASVKQEESLQQMLSRQKEIGVKMTAQHQQYQKMLAKLENIQKFKIKCIEELRQFTLEEEISTSPVVIVDAARPPHKPTGLSKPHQAASILLLGLAFSIGFVFAAERFSAGPSESHGTMPSSMYLPSDGSMPWVIWPGQADPRTAATPMNMQNTVIASDVEKKKNYGEYPYSTLAKIQTIDLGGQSDSEFAFAGRCRIINIDPSCSASETFRELSSNLLTRFGQTRQSIVVTSVLPRNGKTTCASNLAQLLARAGRKVALVEANTSRPALHRAFNINTNENQPDLQDVLMDITKLDQALQQTEATNLTVLVNRNSEPIVDEFTTTNVEWLVNELRQRFDWVIFDAGAVQQTLTKSILAITGKGVCVTNGSELPDEIHGIEAQVELCGAVCLGVVENNYIEKQKQTENKKKTITS